MSSGKEFKCCGLRRGRRRGEGNIHARKWVSSKCEVELEDQISRVKKLSKSLLSRRPILEPIVNQLLMLHKTRLAADNTSQTETIVASTEHFDEQENIALDEKNENSHKVDIEAAQANATSGKPSTSSGGNPENKGKGNKKPKKKKNNKGGRKKN